MATSNSSSCSSYSELLNYMDNQAAHKPGSGRGGHAATRPLAEFEKFKSGSPINSQTKQVVLNVLNKFRNKQPQIAVNDLIKLVSSVTGLGIQSIKKIRKEMCDKGQLKTLGKKRCNDYKKRLHRYDSFIQSAVRSKVYEFFQRREVPTLQKIAVEIQNDESLPNLKRNALRSFLIDIGFKFMRRRKRNAALIERDDIVAWRRKYLRAIRAYRLEGRKIYYTDETWVNAGEYISKELVDDTVQSHRNAFLSGLSTGLKHPTSKEGRLIVGLIGSETEFVQNGLLVFNAKKSDGDYDSEMNSVNFMRWMETIFPSLEKGSVIVMDNAAYHTVKLDPSPTSAWPKENIQKWCIAHNAYFEDHYIKAELMEVVAAVKDTNISYVFDTRAQELGFKVLRLPPHHCSLNPIEMVWSQVKSHVFCNFELQQVERLLRDGIAGVTSQQWENYVSHVKKEEQKMWDQEELIDDVIDQFVINTWDDSSSDDFSDIDDDDDDHDGV